MTEGPAKKVRVPIPRALAAEVLFEADRTCCVCRVSSKPVQIHHIDDDPSNNEKRNLSVLCFDCHRETQIKGGFDRKLDAEQVTLYRDDWTRKVAEARAQAEWTSAELEQLDIELEAATSLAEIYRENEEWELLAMHYNRIGNGELRDKYIDKALAEPDVDPETIVFLRAAIQGRPDLVSDDAADQVLEARDGDALQKARTLNDMGRYREAADNYLKGIRQALTESSIFSAGYYLKELSHLGLYIELLKQAYEEAAEERDLWWQHRALEELGWTTERKDWLLSNAAKIEEEQDPRLLQQLAWARDDADGYLKMEKSIAKDTHIGWGAVWLPTSRNDGSEQTGEDTSSGGSDPE